MSIKRIFRFEIKRAFSKALLVAMFAGCLLSLSDVFLNVIPSVKQIDWIISNGEYPLSLYNMWIGGQARTLPSSLYFFMIPIIGAIPFAESYCFDRLGYYKNIIIRTDKNKYLIAKYLAVFFSSGVAICVPLIINFLATATLMPALIPQATAMTFGIDATSMFEHIFYSHPMMYELIYLFIIFIIGGLLAEISLVVALFTKNRYVVLLFPFMFYLIIYFMADLFEFSSFNIFQMLRPAQVGHIQFIHIVLTGLVLLLATFIPYYYYGQKNETI